MPLPDMNCTGPKWSKKMKGPTICRLPCGSARRTSNPSPRSRVRGTITSSSASQDLGSPSTGSLEGSQLMSFPSSFATIITANSAFSILRDASWSLSSGAHSRDPLAMLLRMRSQILMVRSASLRVSNHEATGGAAMIRRSLRRGVPWRSDIAGFLAEALEHDRGQILGLGGDAAAGTHRVAVLMPELRRPLALLQRAGGLHHQFAEMHDAEIGRAETLAGAVGDRPLAVLHRGVLFRDALDAGIAFGLLQLAVDQIVVRLVTQRNIILVELRDHAVAAAIEVAFGLRQRTLWIPGIGVDPAIGVGHRDKALAENTLARHRPRRIGMHR